MLHFIYPFRSWRTFGLFLLLLWWIMLLWIFTHQFLCERVFSLLLRVYPQGQKSWIIQQFHFYCFLKWPHPLTFSQASIRVLTSPYPSQHLLLSVFFTLAILAGVKWCLTVAQMLFKESVHRKFLHCFPTTRTRNADHSTVVVSWMADSMEGSMGSRTRKRRQPRDSGQSGSYLESTVFWISRYLKTQND